MSNKILILGSNGFVGKAIAKKLRNKTIFKFNRKKNFDLRNENKLTRFLRKKKFKYILNLAAHVGSVHYVNKNQADVYSDNIKIDLSIYNSVSKLKVKPIIINFIANCVYPEKLKSQVEYKILDGSPHESVLAFANSRRNTLSLSKFFNNQHQIITINLVIPSLYGPGDYLDPNRTHALNGIIIRSLKLNMKNDIFDIWGDGKIKREWLFIDDLTNVVSKILNIKNHKLDILNIAKNKSYTNFYLIKKIHKLISIKPKIENLKNNELKIHKERKLNNSKFKKVFKNFNFTDLDLSLKKTINYYKKKL
tara:strand:- start:667 stop:1587 length:921 start_codon:yes stop_codon:yes gene_type:complete